MINVTAKIHRLLMLDRLGAARRTNGGRHMIRYLVTKMGFSKKEAAKAITTGAGSQVTRKA
jgi:hypothetical protein